VVPLRGWVIGAGMACLALGLVLLLSGARAGGIAALIMWGVILAGGVAFERFRYKPELREPPGAGWERTEEISVDARGTVRVWFNPATGERVYVKEK
jgi:hypothetical protein